MHMMRKCFNASLSVKVEKPPGRKFFDDLMKPVHENNLAMLAFCHDADLLRNLYVHNAQWEGNMKVSPGPGVPVFLGKPKIKYVTHILDLSNIWYMYTQHCYMYSSGWLLLYSWKKKKKKKEKERENQKWWYSFYHCGSALNRRFIRNINIPTDRKSRIFWLHADPPSPQ